MIILVRHASYVRSNSKDPSLSDDGRRQAEYLAQRIHRKIGYEVTPVIWTSPAARAKETAEIIRDIFDALIPKFNEYVVFGIHDNLWGDEWHPHDLDWLHKTINNFKQMNPKTPLIIVTHMPYVQQLPEKFGYPQNDSGYAEGVIIHENVIKRI